MNHLCQQLLQAQQQKGMIVDQFNQFYLIICRAHFSLQLESVRSSAVIDPMRIIHALSATQRLTLYHRVMPYLHQPRDDGDDFARTQQIRRQLEAGEVALLCLGKSD